MDFKKMGFTLAEVLITLGIIGVIAALTIPTLIQSAGERGTIVALKKAYSILSSAYKLAENENGTPANWGLNDVNGPQMITNLKPYLNVSKDCTPKAFHAGCWPFGVAYGYLPGSWNTVGGLGITDDWGYASVTLNDVTIVSGVPDVMSCQSQVGDSQALQHVCGRYMVDINGQKKPNKLGLDLFEFWLTTYGIIPTGTAQQTGDQTSYTIAKIPITPLAKVARLG